MLYLKEPEETIIENNFQFILTISFGGFLIGIITGFFGAGGGFIIVPSLMLLSNITFKEAVGTSLVIIVLKSFAGLLSDISINLSYDIKFILLFLSFTSLGVLLGIFFSKKISATFLKKTFAFLMLLLAIVILLKELF